MSCRNAFATLLIFAFSAGVALNAGPEQNEVGAVLVFPTVLNEADASGPTRQTFLTIVNAGPSATGVRVFFVDGTSCGWCDAADLSLLENDSETLRVARNFAAGTTEISALDGATTATCPGANGFAVAVVVDATTGQVLSDNVLLGSSIVRDEALGSSLSIEPIGFPGVNGGDGDLNLEFDDSEYAMFPRIVADTVLAPDLVGGIEATLSLFTLNFNRGTPPLTDCSLTARDEAGFPASASFQFGCWAHLPLESINAEFGYPNWGPGPGLREVIFSQLNCRVDVENDGTFEADGAVHGSVSQRVPAGTNLRRSDVTSPVVLDEIAWGRPMIQSVTAGDATRISFEICNGVDDDLDAIVDEGCDGDADGYCGAALGFSGEPDECSAGVGDCAELDPNTFPDAPEVNDGQDNQCPGDRGFGATDELSGMVEYSVGDDATFCWPAQQGATEYELARALDPDFPSVDCFFAQTSLTCLSDFWLPPIGGTFYYLVRPLLPNAGSWGFSSAGERTGICQ